MILAQQMQLMQLTRWSRKAFAKIANKLKVGLEGGIALGVIPPALGASFTVLNKTLGARPVEGIKALNEKVGNM